MERKKSSKTRESSKKSSDGEAGYLKSTTARKLKDEEKIINEDPYKDEEFATFEPDRDSSGDEIYEEDFDEIYDDDFEDVEFETKAQQEERLEREERRKNEGKEKKENKNPSREEDWEAIQNAINRENSQVAIL